MQIGEFAKICGTKITVLRHYDKEGLLEPDYVDAFTGYRYYSDAQIPVFFRITALKKAGFSLVEIKKILASEQTNESLLGLFEKKQTELSRMIADLDEARKIVACEKKDFDVIFTEKDGALDEVYRRQGRSHCRSERGSGGRAKGACHLRQHSPPDRRPRRTRPHQVFA